MNKCDETIYLDAFDEARQAALYLQRIVPGELCRDEIFANVNYNVYYAMGSDKPLDSPDGVLAAEPQCYRKLLSQVLEIPGVKFLTAFELSSAKPQANEVTCHVRHDVDADIVAALHLARIEHELGIRTTYYLLHTASYYGTWSSPGPDGVVTFSRNEALADDYLELQRLGHEVAIHTDALTLYQQHNVDGATALVAEIDWLRSIGLDIRGTAPHNNHRVYGAGNSAIFKGRNISTIDPAGPMGVVHNGRWAPLGVLDEKNLGLAYEADEPYETAHPVDFYSIVGSNSWWRYYRLPSLRSEIELIIRQNPSFDFTPYLIEKLPHIYRDPSDFRLVPSEIAGKLRTQAAGALVIFSVHPEYYGRRASPTSEPVEVLQEAHNGALAENNTGTWMVWLKAQISKRMLRVP